MSNAATALKIEKGLSKWLNEYKKIWKELSWTQRVYWIGLALAAAAIFPLAVDKGNPIGGGVMITATLLLSSALAYEIHTWLKPRLDTRVLAILTSAITAVGGVLACGLARDALNAATSQDPAIFGYSIILLSLLMTLPSAALAIVFFSLPVMLIVAAKATFLSLKARGKEQGRHIWIGAGRFLAIFLSANAANHLVQPGSWLDPGFPRLAAWSANALDMHADTSCSSSPSDRIARLNDQLVVVSRETPGGYEFFRSDCELIAQKALPHDDQENEGSSSCPKAGSSNEA